MQYQARQVVQALDLAQVKVALLLQSVALKEARVEVQAELLAQAVAQVQLQALELERVVLRQLEVLPQVPVVPALVQAEELVEVLPPEAEQAH